MHNFSLQSVIEYLNHPVSEGFPDEASFPFSGISTDSRSTGPGELFVPLAGERFDGHDYIAEAAKRGAAASLCHRSDVSPPPPLIRVGDTRGALLRLAEGYRSEFDILSVGVTGSVGKTTAKEMIWSVLSEKYDTLKNEGNLNNDIGVPLTVFRLLPRHGAAVFELGMNHAGEIRKTVAAARPDIAVITNIGVMHIGQLGSREAILAAKLEILEGLSPGGAALLNGDDDMLLGVRGRLPCRALYFGVNNPDCDLRALDISPEPSGLRAVFVFPGGETADVFIPAEGLHNVQNALAAAGAGYLAGLSPDMIARGLLNFKNAGMRQNIYDAKGLTIIEDCYNAGPESMSSALELLKNRTVPGKRIAVLGDMLELGEASAAFHEAVGTKAAECSDILLTYGSFAESVRRGAMNAGMDAGRIGTFSSRESVAEALIWVSARGDALLFKGSRGMKMELVLKTLLEVFPND